MSLRRPSREYALAIGIHYNEGADEAPRVGVKGEWALADEVVRLARRYNVPVVEDGELAQTMEALDLDEEIPASLYKAVAIVLNEVESRLSRRR